MQYVLNFFPLLNAQSILLIFYLTIFTSQGCTFPQTYHLFQKDVQSLPANLHNRFPGCLVCLGVSQFLSPMDSFILSCLQLGLNVSDLFYKQFHFAVTTGEHTVSHLLFPMNGFILSRLSRDHSVSDFLSTTSDSGLLCLWAGLDDAGLVSVHRFPFNSGSLVFSSLSISTHVHTMCDHRI